MGLLQGWNELTRAWHVMKIQGALASVIHGNRISNLEQCSNKKRQTDKQVFLSRPIPGSQAAKCSLGALLGPIDEPAGNGASKPVSQSPQPFLGLFAGMQ